MYIQYPQATASLLRSAKKICGLEWGTESNEEKPAWPERAFSAIGNSLKGPSMTKSSADFFTQIRPIWLGDLGTGEKN